MICMEKPWPEIGFLGPLGPWGPKSSGAVDLHGKTLARNQLLVIFWTLRAAAGGRAVAPTLTPLVSTHPPEIAIPLLGGRGKCKTCCAFAVSGGADYALTNVPIS